MNKSGLRRKVGLAIGSVMLLVFTGLVAAAVFGLWGASLAAVGQTWFALFSFVVLMAAVTVLGKEAYETVQSYREKDKEGEG